MAAIKAVPLFKGGLLSAAFNPSLKKRGRGDFGENDARIV
jgi:hypothetical protein